MTRNERQAEMAEEPSTFNLEPSTAPQRASGILLHPTSLPGPYGIGELGSEALRFLDYAAGAGQRLWQVLPLGPTGFGNSPYQAYSAFAGNPALVSTERLLADGLLTEEDLADTPPLPDDRVDYETALPFKERLLRRAHARFTPDEDYHRFQVEQADWLDDYALFMALRGLHDGASWEAWPGPLASRQPEALDQAREEHAREIAFQRFCQYRFFRDWAAVREAARERDIQIVGDLPIFVSFDSADVWANPALFHLDEGNRPTVVAGVPPDYFSATGQRWGNPLYRWDAMARDGYAWWIARLRASLALYDLVRIDHFRGFESYWEIPAAEETAINGRWVPGPGAPFFAAARERLGALPIIAEDLGLITDAVRDLRDELALPGMKVLQFAFSGPDNDYLPHNHPANAVVYTGTHDNDTTAGWWAAAPDHERDFARRYLGRPGDDIVWDLIRAALGSVAALAIVPLQDLLELGSDARMNTPGTESGNWTWRYQEGMLRSDVQRRLRDLTWLYQRLPVEGDG